MSKQRGGTILLSSIEILPDYPFVVVDVVVVVIVILIERESISIRFDYRAIDIVDKVNTLSLSSFLVLQQIEETFFSGCVLLSLTELISLCLRVIIDDVFSFFSHTLSRNDTQFDLSLSSLSTCPITRALIEENFSPTSLNEKERERERGERATNLDK